MQVVLPGHWRKELPIWPFPSLLPFAHLWEVRSAGGSAAQETGKGWDDPWCRTRRTARMNWPRCCRYSGESEVGERRIVKKSDGLPARDAQCCPVCSQALQASPWDLVSDTRPAPKGTWGREIAFEPLGRRGYNFWHVIIVRAPWIECCT